MTAMALGCNWETAGTAKFQEHAKQNQETSRKIFCYHRQYSVITLGTGGTGGRGGLLDNVIQTIVGLILGNNKLWGTTRSRVRQGRTFDGKGHILAKWPMEITGNRDASRITATILDLPRI
jgi:hypothetical protein